MTDEGDAVRIEHLIERSSLGSPNARRLRGRVAPGRDSKDYTAGYRDGENSLTADIKVQFDDFADTMDDLLEFFRRLTGDPELTWPGNTEDEA